MGALAIWMNGELVGTWSVGRTGYHRQHLEYCPDHRQAEDARCGRVGGDDRAVGLLDQDPLAQRRQRGAVEGLACTSAPRGNAGGEAARRPAGPRQERRWLRPGYNRTRERG